jgi:hypothetical protein
MRNIIESTITLLVAVTGFIGGTIWFFSSPFEMEPIILIVISLLEIIGYIALKFTNKDIDDKSKKYKQEVKNEGKIKKQVNIQRNKGDIKM